MTIFRVDGARDKEIQIYMRKLREHSTVTTIDFQESRLSDLCTCMLFKQLLQTHGKTVKQILFHKQPIGVRTLRELRKFEIDTICINGSPMQEAAFALLIDYLREDQLQGLQLASLSSHLPESMIAQLFSTIVSLKKLKMLLLGDMHYNDSSIASQALSRLLVDTCVSDLYLVGVQVADTEQLLHELKTTTDDRQKIRTFTIGQVSSAEQATYMAMLEGLFCRRRLENLRLRNMKIVDAPSPFAHAHATPLKMNVEFIECQLALEDYNAWMETLLTPGHCHHLNFNRIHVLTSLPLQATTTSSLRAMTAKPLPPTFFSFANVTNLTTLKVEVWGVHPSSRYLVKSLCYDLSMNTSIIDLTLNLKYFDGQVKGLPFFSVNKTLVQFSVLGQWPKGVEVFGDDEENTTLRYFHCASLECRLPLGRMKALTTINNEDCVLINLEACKSLERLSISGDYERYLEVLDQLPRLTHVKLSKFAVLTKEMNDRLARALDQSTTLDKIEYIDTLGKKVHVMRKSSSSPPPSESNWS